MRDAIALDKEKKANIISADLSRKQVSDLVLASFDNAVNGKEGMEADEFFKKLEDRYRNA